MKQQFYSLPLALDQVIHQRELIKCSLQKSIEQHLHLILTTAFGELPGDEAFGCCIWDNDFDIVTSGHSLRESLRQSILESIKQYERRLCNVRVELAIRQQELQVDIGRQIKKKVEISIAALLQSTNEKFSHRYNFFIGPLSY